LKYRPVALTVEHRTPNPGVGGSNPSWPAILYFGEAQCLKAKAVESS
jgi:hypothetical protein